MICFSQLIYHISLSDRNSSRRGRPSPEPASRGVSCICYFDSLFPERLSNPDAGIQSSRLSFFGLSFISRSHFTHKQMTDSFPSLPPRLNCSCPQDNTSYHLSNVSVHPILCILGRVQTPGTFQRVLNIESACQVVYYMIG